MKSCKTCGVAKPDSSFTSEIRRGELYVKPTCRDCRNAAKRERWAAGLDRPSAEQQADNRLRSLFGISLAEKNEMLARQGGCAICGTNVPGGNGWAVDHDHACYPDGNRKTCGNCVRGILCHHCNALLGYAKDNPDTLQRAAVYLYETKNVLGVPND